MRFYGKEIDIPRLTAWYGDPGKSYTYSGISMPPLPWTETLRAIKSRIEGVVHAGFNSVLLNCYRSGKDGVSWHSDDEPELGPQPIIGSLSLGGTRVLQLRHKIRKYLPRVELALGAGSLLVMRDQTQRYWQHRIPKTKKSVAPRINLTFRVISGKACCLLMTAALLAAPLHADAAEPKGWAAEDRRWFVRLDAMARANPAGVMVFGGAFHRLAFAAHDKRRAPDPLLQSSSDEGRYLQAGLSVGVNPAYSQLSVPAEWIPAAPLKIAARYDFFKYYGGNSGLLSFPAADSLYGNRERDALAGREESALAHRFMLSPTLRAKFGRILAQNQTDIARYRFSGRGPFFLELEYDTLLSSPDTLIANRTQLLYIHEGPQSRRLAYGPFFEFQRSQGSSLERMRLAALAYLTPSERTSWLLKPPRFYLLTGINLKDRNRRQQFFLVAGFTGEFN